MSDGESGSLGRRDHSLWKLGSELADRIADLCSRGACPQRLLNHVVERLKCNPPNFQPQFPEPLCSVGLEILDGPASIDWRNWTVEIDVKDWIGGDGGDWTGWREVTRLLGMKDATDANDLLDVHGKTYPIEIFDEAIKEAVAELWPRLARWFGTAPPTSPRVPTATPAATRASSQMPPIPKKRGPKAFKRDPTVDRMVKDYAGRASALNDEREKTLAATYGVSRTTAREARKVALSKL